MDTQFAAPRNRTGLALMGGLVLIVGLGVSPLHAAFADDDDWHTEANRPLAPQQQIRDRDEIQASLAGKPAREEVYAPPCPSATLPAHYIESSYQTADVDGRH